MKLLFIVILLLQTVTVLSANQKRGLVVLDDLQIRNTHSLFFSTLEQQGNQLTYYEASNPKLELSRYGEYLYDFLILFAPHADAFSGSLDVDAVLNFIDDGNNVIIAADSEVSDPTREIVEECGVDFGPAGTFVIDHFNYDVSDFDGDHTLIVADDIVNKSIITSSSAPILFRGVDQVLEEKNSLLIPIVRASSTAYAYSPDEAVVDEPHSSGKQTVLISALQARNNARVLISGSLEFFSDRFFTSPVQKYSADGSSQRYETAGNRQLASDLAAWALKQRGVLRSSNLHHHKVDETVQGSVYCVNDTITYSVDIEEWDGQKWVPYQADDVQLEFVMLDPYYRVNLRHDGKGRFSTTYVVPDVYGIYTFRLDYNRVGYTSINENHLVTVRPYRHNEYERFIVAAYPYYASAFSMMFGLFVFSFFFLYNRDSKAKAPQ